MNPEQISIVLELKEFASNSIESDNIDEDVANSLATSMEQNNFTIDQFWDLNFYITNPSLTQTTGCFWCNEVISEGPCDIQTDENGTLFLGREVEFRRVRFGIGFGHRTTVVPCTIWEWVANDPNN